MNNYCKGLFSKEECDQIIKEIQNILKLKEIKF